MIRHFLHRLLFCGALLASAGSATVLSGCNTTPSYLKQYEEHREQQKTLDDASIMKYLTDNNIKNYTRTESGLYLVPVTDAPAGATTIEKGQRVETQYIGKFINDGVLGTTFDSSYDNRTPCQCFQVVAGDGSVIKGWDEALLLMKPGDRKLLLIPSGLAYGFNDGTSAPPANIGPDRVLQFDMIVTKRIN
ncbi:FKBP-type peptidyl-prolyl cis-trans isomerase [Hymenobacter aerilatus]|uniref:Peptidyl-prolyl cis-trans isomerase n=1 Tax=Hymenobacter aerilatus TaxID=2932251 RepID=A0A8T9SS96_9BACT|nr:FKBP-type peptidyl-prolyl cis-trans isomerase [Hymenobacter aerilatus]UOR04231.1 FKBP-type peptidyl-prolyl cis-trans isomerase [Hymenobacter aerilatus]